MSGTCGLFIIYEDGIVTDATFYTSGSQLIGKDNLQIT